MQPLDFKRGKLISGIIYPVFFPFSGDDEVLNIGCGDGVQAVSYKGVFKHMVGVDINAQRLALAEQVMEHYQIKNFTPICADVEAIPLQEQFDKIIAIDIIEHVKHPDQLIAEIRRLLKDDGRALITFPASHDRWVYFFRFIGRQVLRRRSRSPQHEGWHPDDHAHDYSIRQWLALTTAGGLVVTRSRASTMFPPLHLVGVPRFWFSNPIIHAIDSAICRIPLVKNFGQTLVCEFRKAL